MSYIGRDGQRYETLQQVVLADKKYKMIEEQNQLLEEQKALLEKQNEINAENQRIALLKLQEENNEKAAQREHEQNMRLLKLCDDVGINKSIVDNYIDYIFNSAQVDKKDYKIIAEYENKYRDLTVKNAANAVFVVNIAWIKRIKESFESQVNTMEIEQNIDKNKLVDDYEEDIYNSIVAYNKTKSYYAVINWLFIPIFCIGIFYMIISATEGSDEFFGKMFLFMIVVLIIYGFCLLFLFSKRNSVKEELEDNIDQALKYNKSQIQEDVKENMNDIKKKLNDLQTKWIKQKMETLDEFRINHYNAKIDKLLFDFGLNDKLNKYGLKYKIFSKNEAKATGSIEDYVSFFVSESEKYN